MGKAEDIASKDRIILDLQNRLEINGITYKELNEEMEQLLDIFAKYRPDPFTLAYKQKLFALLDFAEEKGAILKFENKELGAVVEARYNSTRPIYDVIDRRLAFIKEYYNNVMSATLPSWEPLRIYGAQEMLGVVDIFINYLQYLQSESFIGQVVKFMKTSFDFAGITGNTEVYNLAMDVYEIYVRLGVMMPEQVEAFNNFYQVSPDKYQETLRKFLVTKVFPDELVEYLPNSRNLAKPSEHTECFGEGSDG